MSPIYILLFALLSSSTATLSSLFSGRSAAVQPAPAPAAHGHGHGSSGPQVIKVILQLENHGHSHHDYGQSNGHTGHTEIYKVIHESAGRSHGESYAPSYGHDSYASHGSEGHGSNSKLMSILPQILQIVLQDDAHGSTHGSGNTYGNGGSFFSTASKDPSFYKSGYVVEKGELKLRQIPSSKAGNKGSLLAALPFLSGDSNNAQQSGGHHNGGDQGSILPILPFISGGQGSGSQHSSNSGWNSRPAGW